MAAQMVDMRKAQVILCHVLFKFFKTQLIQGISLQMMLDKKSSFEKKEGLISNKNAIFVKY